MYNENENKGNVNDLGDWDSVLANNTPVRKQTQNEDNPSINNIPKKNNDFAKKYPFLKKNRRASNEKKKTKSKICVVVRKRPLNTSGNSRGETDIVDVLDVLSLIVNEPKYVM